MQGNGVACHLDGAQEQLRSLLLACCVLGTSGRLPVAGDYSGSAKQVD